MNSGYFFALRLREFGLRNYAIDNDILIRIKLYYSQTAEVIEFTRNCYKEGIYYKIIEIVTYRHLSFI